MKTEFKHRFARRTLHTFTEWCDCGTWGINVGSWTDCYLLNVEWHIWRWRFYFYLGD